MNRKIFYFSLLSLSISACSGVNNKQASGDFEYANNQVSKEISVPDALDKPKKSEKFFISDAINHQGPVGEKVDIRAPSLVLPIAASSRVESNSDEAVIWFDKVLEDKELQPFIYQAVEKHLASKNVSLHTVDAENKIFESDWFHNEKETGFWFFKSTESSESTRYKFSFEAKPHGRSVALKVALVDYMKTDINGGSKSIDLIDKQRAEMNMLNEIISQVDYQYRLQQQENRLMRSNQHLVSLAENSRAEPAYLVEIPIDSLWSNMPIFFDTYGFSISDLNESKKIYFVDYVKRDSSFWDRIWGEEIPVIDIANGKYQFILADYNEKTSVTIYDESGKALSNDILSKIMPVVEPGLSFR